MLKLVASLMLAILALLAPTSAFTTASARASEDENHPPDIDEGSLVLEGPEVVGGTIYGLVGDVISGSVKVSDPDGDDVNVTIAFILREDWAEALGASDEERIRNITAELVEPAPLTGPRTYKFTANTTGWLPGTYDVLIVAQDERGARDMLKFEALISLRLEITPPLASRIWMIAGLAILACLICVMALGFVKAMREVRKRERERPLPWLY